MLSPKQKNSYSNIMFEFFDIAWPGIEHTASRTQGGRSSNLAIAPVDS